METQEILRLKNKYSALAEEELIGLLLVDKSEYDPEAYELLCSEAVKRGLDDKIEQLKNINKEPAKVEIPVEELKIQEYVQIMIIVDSDDVEAIEAILSKKDILCTIDTLSIAGNNFPAQVTVQEQRLKEAVSLLKDFKPKKGGLILW